MRTQTREKLFSIFTSLTLLSQYVLGFLTPNFAYAVASPVWPTSWVTPSGCFSDPSDESPSEVDLIGDTGNPAVGFNSDSDFFYFRERVEGNPGTVSGLSNFSWVVLFQTSTPQYQYLATISGKSGNNVLLYDNTTHSPDSTGVDFSPLFNDPADNVLWQGPAATYGRVTGSGPYYIDWAIPSSELTSRGITTSTTKFFATSANANNYNKDHLDCYEAIADLSLDKTDTQDPINAGSEVSYTITVANAGPDAAENVVVTDNVPAEIVAPFSVSPSQGVCSDNSLPSPVTCELGTINNGANATVSVTGTVPSSFTGDSITNTATVSSDTLDTNTSNNGDSEPTGIVALGTIIVEKQTVPDGDQTDFTFSGSAEGAISDGEQIVVDELAPGQYFSSEIVPDGWDLTSISCSDENSSGDLETNTATFSVEGGETVTCVFTNSRRPILTVVKSVLNDYGTAAQPDDFDLKVDSLSVDSDVSNIFNPGNYTVWEDLTLGPDGYVLTSISEPCDTEGNILLSYGDDITCTITNTAVAPQLIVIKHVVNNYSGDEVAGNFTMNVDGTEVSDSSFPGNETGTIVTLDAGEYEVTESGPDGYSASFSEDCDGTIGIGDEKTCTITNDDVAPTLSVVKEVVNDNGGDAVVDDFNIELNDVDLVFGSGVVSDNTATYTATPTVLSNTAYNLTEDDLTGYDEGSWSCVDDDTEQSVTHPITLNEGQNVTCTITNDDIQPLLTVTKVVEGSDVGVENFPLFVDQTQVTSGVPTGFNAGPYTVSETSDPDYSGVISGECASNGAITLNVGDNKSCTITNTRKTGTVTFDKVVVGGEESDSAWDFTIDGVEGSFKDGDEVILPTGTYTVEESGSDSYFPTGVGGICSVDSEGEEGEAIVMNVTTDGGTCSFTNTLKTYDLFITKDDGVTAPVLAGGTVVYTIGYGNSGNQTVNGAVITEMVPASTSFKASASDAGWSCPDGSSAGTICTFDVGDLAPGESGSVLFAVTVSPLITGIDGTTNVVTISGRQDDDSSNNTADDDTPLKPGAVLAAEDGDVLPQTGSSFINLLFAALAFEVGLYLRRRSRRA